MRRLLTRGWCAALLACLAWLGFNSSAYALLGLGGHTALPDEPVIDSLSVHSASGKSFAQISTSSLARQDVIVGDYDSTAAELAKLLKKIRSKSPAPGLPVWLKIDSNPVANAHTLAGGNIIINAGLIKALKSRSDKADALAFIVAHEYSHAFFNDPANEVSKENKVNQVGQSVSLVANLVSASRSKAGMAAAASCGRRSGTNPMHVLAGAVMTGDWVKAELYRFTYGPFSREVETRADFLAVDLMVRAGMNPVAGSKPIEDLYEKYDNSVRKALQAQLKSVQSTIEKSLADLGTCAPDMLKQTLGGGASLQDQMHSFVKNQLIGWTSQFIKSRFDRRRVHVYYSADARVKAIHDYAEKFYPGKIVDTSVDLSAFGGSNPFGKFAQEDDIYEMTDEIVELNIQGQYDQAMAKVEKAEKKTASRPIDFLVAAGTAAKGAGKSTRAIAYFEAASKKPEAVGLVFRSLADLYAEQRKYGSAIVTLDRAEKKLKDEKQFIVSRISVYHAKGDEPAVGKLVKKCEAFGDSDLAGQCRDAGGVKPEGGIMGDTQKAAGTALDQTGKAAGNIFHRIRGAVPIGNSSSDTH